MVLGLIIGVALFGITWLAGVVGSLGATFHISSMRTAGHVAQYLIPTDGLWHAAIYYLEPPQYVVQQLADRGRLLKTPTPAPVTVVRAKWK